MRLLQLCRLVEWPPLLALSTMKRVSIVLLVLCPLVLSAQLAVRVCPVKVTGQKAVVPLAMKNGFAEPIESARAVCFLLDDQGKVVGQSTKWVIGGDRNRAVLAPGATNAFNFVLSLLKPTMATNLTARVSFSRVILGGAKAADPNRDVQIQPAKR